MSNYLSNISEVRYQAPSIPVVFCGTIDGNITVKDVEKNGNTFKRAVFTVEFFGKPQTRISNLGKFEISEKNFKIPAVASYEAAETIAKMKHGDQIIGAGYAYNNNGKVWLIVQPIAKASSNSEEVLFKSTLNPIYFNEEDEKPVFIVGSYQNKYQRDVKDGTGCSASISLYHKSEMLKKLCGEDVYLSGNDDYTNLSVLGFSYQAKTMRSLDYNDDFIAGGTISTHEYNGKKYATFFASVILSPRNKNKNTDSADKQQEEDNNGSTTADTSSPATTESTPDTESGEGLTPEEELDLML